MTTYNINSQSAIRRFFSDLILIHKLVFHPDTPFEDYINLEDNTRTFTDQEAAHYNKVMQDCFDYAAAQKLDLYELAERVTAYHTSPAVVTKQTLIDAFLQFQKATSELSRAMIALDLTESFVTELYPFTESFAQVNIAVHQWAESSLEQLEEPEPELLIDSNRGQYIPQLFAQGYSHYVVNKDALASDLAILLYGPEHEHYWEAWENVLDNAILKNEEGQYKRLDQDQDLWAVHAAQPETTPA